MGVFSKENLKKSAQNTAGGIAAGLAVTYGGWFVAGLLATQAIISIVDNKPDKEFAKGFLSGGLDALIPDSAERWIVNRLRR